MGYIYDHPEWPDFKWDSGRLANKLFAIYEHQGRLVGRMEAIGFPLQAEAELQNLTQTVLKSSEIEGEVLDRQQVRSSIARRLGLDVAGLVSAERQVDGVVEMMLDATQQFDEPLTKERLWGWHAGLFSERRNQFGSLRVGIWRDDRNGPMQILSGPIGREKKHFEAPPANLVDREMREFLRWFNLPLWSNLILGAGIAHIWFVTIHPFEDGNGRIARALTDMVLSKLDYSPRRFYSMSDQILAERKSYYAILEETQKGGLDITLWLEWFLGCLDCSIVGAENLLQNVIGKARFWQRVASESLNERQRKVLNRMLDGMEGKLTSSRWARMGSCSQDTASRDIDDLIRRGILIRNPGGGRSTSYSLLGIS